MILLSKLFSIVITIAGCIFFMKSELLSNLIDKFKEDLNIYYMSAVSILVGFIFIRSASMSRIVWIVFLFGFLMIVKGILAFVLKKDKVIELIDKVYVDRSEPRLRICASILGGIGIILLCAL